MQQAVPEKRGAHGCGEGRPASLRALSVDGGEWPQCIAEGWSRRGMKWVDAALRERCPSTDTSFCIHFGRKDESLGEGGFLVRL